MVDSPFSVRPIDESEFPGFWDVLQACFHRADPVRQRDLTAPLMEYDRTLAVFDPSAPSDCRGAAGAAGSGRMIATSMVHSLTLTVPGGPRPVAGVTMVGVLPSHRRRGVMRALMLRWLNALHESGEPVAALWASEAALYRRYGYGPASQAISMTISRGEGTFIRDAPHDPSLRVRLAAPSHARPHLEELYAAHADRPGFLPRSEAWWDMVLHDPEHARDGYGPQQCVLVEDDGRARGYALFAVTHGYDDHAVPNGTLRVGEVSAADPAAYAALWRHLLDRDLVATVRAPFMAVDEPVQYLMADPRRLRTTIVDALWIRLVDLDRALAQRSYAVPVDMVLGVNDPICPWNTGKWRLSGDASGAACERTTAPADVELPASVLGSAYLGEVRLAGPARSGLVTEGRTGALNALSAALAWDPRPWCPMDF